MITPTAVPPAAPARSAIKIKTIRFSKTDFFRIVTSGGTIGDLAVNSTANDLAMCRARPLHLSAAFTLEEGFPLADLARIVDCMAELPAMQVCRS